MNYSATSKLPVLKEQQNSKAQWHWKYFQWAVLLIAWIQLLCFWAAAGAGENSHFKYLIHLEWNNLKN